MVNFCYMVKMSTAYVTQSVISKSPPQLLFHGLMGNGAPSNEKSARTSTNDVMVGNRHDWPKKMRAGVARPLNAWCHLKGANPKQGKFPNIVGN